MNYKYVIFILGCAILLSCKNSAISKEKEKILEEVKEMEGKSIQFPSEMYADFKLDSLLAKKNKLIIYIDSAECTECSLALDEWSVKIREMKQVNKDVAFVFIVNSNNYSVVKSILNKHRFYYPVFIDSDNCFFKLNSLNKNRKFQVFLLNDKDKIILVGDPVRNDNIWTLYKKELRNKKNASLAKSKTDVIQMNTSIINWGNFSYDASQNYTFILKNISKELLVVENIFTSCSCTIVSYDKEPILPRDSLEIKVCFKAEHRGYFKKAITVCYNLKDSPITLYVSGNVM